MSAASMWPTDPIFGEVLIAAGLKRSPFVALPEALSAADVATPETLMRGLVRVLRSDAANAAANVVFIWVLERPYPHPSGDGEPSTVSYVEITRDTIKQRWSPGKLSNFITDEGCAYNVPHPGNNIAALADHDFNWSFMSQVLTLYGPMQVWWATLDDLNASAEGIRDGVDGWERSILAAYKRRYGRYPLRNRRG